MALKQVFVLLAALCVVLGRPTEVDDARGTVETSKCDTESDKVETGSPLNYYPLGRPMAFIPVYYLPPHGIAPKLKLRRPIQKEGEMEPTMVYSNPKMSQNMKFRTEQKNLERNPSSKIAQPAQSTQNVDQSLEKLGHVDEQKTDKDDPVINRDSSSTELPSTKAISSADSQEANPHPSSDQSTGLSGNLDQQQNQDRATLMNPQSSSVDSQTANSPGMDLPVSKSVDEPKVMGQEDLVSLAELSPLAIPRLKRSPQFRRLPPYGYDAYAYGGYGGYGGGYGGYGGGYGGYGGGYGGYPGYPGYPGYGPYDDPFYGDEVIDIDVQLI